MLSDYFVNSFKMLDCLGTTHTMVSLALVSSKPVKYGGENHYENGNISKSLNFQMFPILPSFWVMFWVMFEVFTRVLG